MSFDFREVGAKNRVELSLTRHEAVNVTYWHQIRAFLEYKVNRLRVHYYEVNESGASVRCSACLHKTGPSGLSGPSKKSLNIRLSPTFPVHRVAGDQMFKNLFDGPLSGLG